MPLDISEHARELGEMIGEYVRRHDLDVSISDEGFQIASPVADWNNWTKVRIRLNPTSLGATA